MKQNKILNIFLLLLLFNNISKAQQQNTPNITVTTPTAIPEVLPQDIPATALGGKKNYLRTYVALSPQTDETLINITSAPNMASVSSQYYDGLGRPIQTVLKRGVSATKDLVSTNVYDELGRVTTQYLPYSTSSNIGKFKQNAFTELDAFYNTQTFSVMGSYNNDKIRYSKTTYDNSPMNRVVKTEAPGNAWGGAGKGVEMFYEINESEDIKIWDIDASGIPYVSTSYADYELYKTRTTDEDLSEVTEYKDKEGKVILKKVFQSTQTQGNSIAFLYLLTYYIYNDLGQLKFVLPPLAVEQLENQLSWTVSQTLLDELCYQYVYDEKGRTIEKKIPGKDWEYVIYDKQDRPILVQDGHLRINNQWAFTIYDQLGRTKVSGIYTNSDSRNTIQTNITIATSPLSSTLTDLSYWHTNYNIQNYDYPTTITDAEIYNIIYYDNYPTFVTNTFNTSYVMPSSLPTNAVPIEVSNMVDGQITYSKTKVLKPIGSNLIDWIENVNYYDKYARLIQTQQTNAVGGKDILTNQYDFVGKVLATYSQHSNPSPNLPLSASQMYNTTNIVRRFTYDNQQRLTGSYCSINGLPEMPIVNNQYDALGRLSGKSLGGGAEHQNYTYNLRGWLTAINPYWVKTPTPSSKNYFGEILSYDEGFDIPKYNGNIAGIIWRGADITKGQRSYGYQYDYANKLLQADFRENQKPSANSTTYNNVWENNQLDFSVSNINYDANGNILTMNQKGPGVNPYDPPVDMDLMNYTYQNIGGITTNKLAKVIDNTSIGNNGNNHDFKDGSNGGADDYEYDENGNLIKDENKEITSITYTYLNKPEIVKLKNGNNIQYVYDAGGNKLQKIVTDVSNNKTNITDYVNVHIYETEILNASTPSTQLAFILHEEGRIRPFMNTQSQEVYTYDFFIKDHLGNVRATINSVPTFGMPDRIKDYVATMEVPFTIPERLMFDDLDKVLANRPGGTSTNSRAIVLNGADPERRIGTSLMLRMMPGDEYSIKTHSYYNTTTLNDPIDPSELVGNIINSLTASNEGVTGEMNNQEIIHNSFSNSNFIPAFTQLNNASTDHTKPLAYLNYLFFDERFNLVPELSGTVQVSTPNTWEEITTGATPIQANRPGYLYVFHSVLNSNKVYFDDFDLTYYKGDLLEENHYYPFGLTIDALSYHGTGNGAEQKYKYNGKELQRDEFVDGNGIKTGLEWYDYGARMQDPQIGRWFNIDPLAEIAPDLTPFRYAYNNPISFIDPNGMSEDYFKNSETGEVLYSSSTEPTIQKDGQCYDNIGKLYTNTSEFAGTTTVQTKYDNEIISCVNYTTPQNSEINATQISFTSQLMHPSGFNPISYDISMVLNSFNDVSVFFQNYFTSNPRGLDGTMYTKGTKEHVGSSLSGMATVFGGVIGKGVSGINATKGMNPNNLIPTEVGRTWSTSTRNVAEIMNSAKTEGILKPIDVYLNNGKTYIINGHHRVQAAMRLGQNVPVNYLSSPTNYSNIFELQNAAYKASFSPFKVDGRMLNSLIKP